MSLMRLPLRLARSAGSPERLPPSCGFSYRNEPLARGTMPAASSCAA